MCKGLAGSFGFAVAVRFSLLAAAGFFQIVRQSKRLQGVDPLHHEGLVLFCAWENGYHISLFVGRATLHTFPLAFHLLDCLLREGMAARHEVNGFDVGTQLFGGDRANPSIGLGLLVVFHFKVDLHHILQTPDASLDEFFIFVLVDRAGFGGEEKLDDGVLVVEVARVVRDYRLDEWPVGHGTCRPAMREVFFLFVFQLGGSRVPGGFFDELSSSGNAGGQSQ